MSTQHKKHQKNSIDYLKVKPVLSLRNSVIAELCFGKLNSLWESTQSSNVESSKIHITFRFAPASDSTPATIRVGSKSFSFWNITYCQFFTAKNECIRNGLEYNLQVKSYPHTVKNYHIRICRMMVPSALGSLSRGLSAAVRLSVIVDAEISWNIAPSLISTRAVFPRGAGMDVQTVLVIPADVSSCPAAQTRSVCVKASETWVPLKSLPHLSSQKWGPPEDTLPWLPTAAPR